MSKCPYFNTLPAFEEDVWKLVAIKAPNVHTFLLHSFYQSPLEFSRLNTRMSR